VKGKEWGSIQTMMDQPLEPLRPEDFQELIEIMSNEDYGELTLEQFCAAMAAIHEEPPEVRLRIGITDVADELIVQHPDLAASVERARQQKAAGQVKTLAEVRRKYALEQPPQRNP
jgi:hypothetical protein